MIQRHNPQRSESSPSLSLARTPLASHDASCSSPWPGSAHPYSCRWPLGPRPQSSALSAAAGRALLSFPFLSLLLSAARARRHARMRRSPNRIAHAIVPASSFLLHAPRKKKRRGRAARLLHPINRHQLSHSEASSLSIVVEHHHYHPGSPSLPATRSRPSPPPPPPMDLLPLPSPRHR